MYAFAECLQKAAHEAKEGRDNPAQYVQLRILKGQTTACGRIEGLYVAPDGANLWRVALLWPFEGHKYVLERHLRACGGVDSCCTCQTHCGADTGRGGGPACGEAPRPVEALGYRPMDAFERLHFELLKQAARRDVMVTRHFIPENRKNCLKNEQS